ncbi:MAG: HAD family hydrolase [Alloprevotella sp.]|nr:HAD family hydrolase [Alloprevotella sp.]
MVYIFDLDGTLLDTLSDLTAAVNHALGLHGLSAKTKDDVRRCLGNGYARLIGDVTGYGETDERTRAILADFQTYYEQHLADLTAPYDGIVPLLQTLRQRGAKIGIVSNKGNEAVQQLSARFFGGLIDVAVGESQTVRRKPNPDALLEVMRTLGCTPTDALYIGDSEVDIETACRANIPCLSCTWGFRTEAFLRQHGAQHFVHRPEEVVGA